MSSGFSAREGRAYDRWKTAGPDEPNGPACPLCGEETENWERGFMSPEGWESGSVSPCDACQEAEDAEDEEETEEEDEE